MSIALLVLLFSAGKPDVIRQACEAAAASRSRCRASAKCS